MDGSLHSGCITPSLAASQAVSTIVGAVCGQEAASGALAYYERVGSADDPADPPSRLDRPPALPGWGPAAQVQLAPMPFGRHRYLRGSRDAAL